MVGDCPIEFLHTAVCCCQMEPQARPSFAATVKHLEVILIDYPRRPEFPLESICLRDVSESHTATDTTCSSSSSSSLSPAHILKEENGHRQRTNSENKRRMSWISGRYKLFHSATDDLLKSTPAKLMGFFKNVLGLSSKELSVHAKGITAPQQNIDQSSSNPRRRSQSSYHVLTHVSPLPSKGIAPFHHDLNENWTKFTTNHNKSAADGNPSHSVSCPGSPGPYSTRYASPSRRHTISPCSPELQSIIPDFNLSINSKKSKSSESGQYGNQPDVASVSSGFDSMPDGSNCYKSTSFTE